jgi:hypothetical protein
VGYGALGAGDRGMDFGTEFGLDVWTLGEEVACPGYCAGCCFVLCDVSLRGLEMGRGSLTPAASIVSI